MKYGNSNTLGTGKKTIMLYGPSGSGKTRLACSAPGAYALLAEQGLTSVADLGIDFTFLESSQDILEILLGIRVDGSSVIVKHDGRDVKAQTLVLDSATVLNSMIMDKTVRDNKRTIAGMQDWMMGGLVTENIITRLCNLPCNVIVTCLETIEKDEMSGRIICSPFLPGKLSWKIPAMFDEVWHLRQQPQGPDKPPKRLALTSPDGIYSISKDRSGKLLPLEEFTLVNPRENQIWKKLGIVPTTV